MTFASMCLDDGQGQTSLADEQASRRKGGGKC